LAGQIAGRCKFAAAGIRYAEPTRGLARFDQAVAAWLPSDCLRCSCD